jgi:hypothetical protein
MELDNRKNGSCQCCYSELVEEGGGGLTFDTQEEQYVGIYGQ